MEDETDDYGRPVRRFCDVAQGTHFQHNDSMGGYIKTGWCRAKLVSCENSGFFWPWAKINVNSFGEWPDQGWETGGM